MTCCVEVGAGEATHVLDSLTREEQPFCADLQQKKSHLANPLPPQVPEALLGCVVWQEHGAGV